MKDKKKMYEIPESEDIKVHVETNFLQTGTGGGVDPINPGGPEDGQ